MRILFRVFVAVTFAFLTATAAHAAAWSRTYGSGTPSSVRQTADGSYILAGYSGSRSWLMKLDASGNATWKRVRGGGDGVGPGSTSESAVLAEPAADGGYTVLGNSRVFSTWQPQQSTWISKLDGSGNVQWHKEYVGVGNIESAQPTADGGFLAAGARYVAPSGYEAVVLKFGAGGDLVWRAALKGNQEDMAHFVQATSDGGAIVAGHTFPSSTVGSTKRVDAWVTKLDGQGQIVWQKTYGGPGYDFARFVSPTNDGGYVVAGDTDSFGPGNSDIWIWKLDAGGSLLWQRTYGGFDRDNLSAVHPTEDDGVVVAGVTCSFGAGDCDGWVFEVDATGWIGGQRLFGGTGHDSVGAIEPVADGGYVVAGIASLTSLGPDASGAWVVKVGAKGTISGCSIVDYSHVAPWEAHATAQEGNLSSQVSFALPYVESSVPWSDAEIMSLQQCYAPSPESRMTAVEYYYRTFDHYFLTALPQEIAALDAGTFPGWVRTGLSFQTYSRDPAVANVCRFWSGQTFAPKSSHFYTPYTSECDHLRQQGVWQFEGYAFGLELPTGLPGQGTCGTAMQPLYRAYNNGMSGAPNHRYTTDPAVLDAMIAQGWITEGEAATRVFACVPEQE